MNTRVSRRKDWFQMLDLLLTLGLIASILYYRCLYGGLPDNKITALAGESATGKTFFALGIVHKFLGDNPDAVVLYFDTEHAITSDMVRERGIDPKRIAILPVGTVEEFRHQAISVVDKYRDRRNPKKPMLIVLDSLGMLSLTRKWQTPQTVRPRGI